MQTSLRKDVNLISQYASVRGDSKITWSKQIFLSKSSKTQLKSLHRSIQLWHKTDMVLPLLNILTTQTPIET